MERAPTSQIETISDVEKMQMQATARISKSLVAFGRSLQDRCIVIIFGYAPLLHKNLATREQFTRLSPVLRRDLLKRLGAFGAVIKARGQSFNDQQCECVFSLVQLLLNEFVTEFDFGVCGGRSERNRETWRLLVERCPNLERVVDDSETTSQNPLLLERVLKLSSLQHVSLKNYVCSYEGVLQLLQTFPNLRSLGIAIWGMSRDVFNKLATMQKLETLWVDLGIYFVIGGNPQYPHTPMVSSRGEMMAGFLQKLPLLQEVTIISRQLLQEAFTMHNQESFVLQQPLALRTLRVKGSLKDWTCEQLPHVTTLHLHGPLADVNEFLGFKNLTVLVLIRVSAADVMPILKHCASKLQQLRVVSESAINVDLHELFSACPNLRSVNMDDGVKCDEGNPAEHPVGADNFKKLKSVKLWLLQGGPSSILMEILKAPGLEKLNVNRFQLDVAQFEELAMLLQQRKILQHLREIRACFFAGAQQAENEHCLTFVKMLESFAPRLTPNQRFLVVNP